MPRSKGDVSLDDVQQLLAVAWDVAIATGLLLCACRLFGAVTAWCDDMRECAMRQVERREAFLLSGVPDLTTYVNASPLPPKPAAI